MIRTLVLALCATLLSAPAAAQTSDWNDDELVTSLGVSDLAAMARVMGHEVVPNAAESPLLVSAKTPEGVVYGMVLAACADGAECAGLRMQVLFDLTDDITDARVNEVNTSFAAVTMVSDRSLSRLSLSRYVILDYGVTRKNVRANLAVLLQILSPALKKLNE